jgi:carbonic anhydrase
VSSEDYDMIWEDTTVKMVCKEKEKCSKPLAKVIDTDYSEFEARELHFHTPSEHTINGQYYPMEV